ncbi:unnamed protein product, partial [Notodromas monacha]
MNRLLLNFPAPFLLMVLSTTTIIISTALVDSTSISSSFKSQSLHQQHGERQSAMDPDWWHSTAMYQIYPRSFKDSDGDGIGDLRGILSEVDHMANLGVETIWLSPVYRSPMADFGYDISDFRDVDPIFGTLDDLRDLLDAVHERGEPIYYSRMRLLMDLVPNHSSDEHEWFVKSVQRIDPFTDYYVWVDPKGFDDNGDPIPPSNWDIVTFWLEFGVDGFRCDAVAQIGEVNDYYLDEPLSENPWETDPENYGYLQHIYTSNHPQTFQVLRNIRMRMDEFVAETGTETKFMIAEIYENITTSLLYYGTEEEPIAHLPFNFRFVFDGELNGDVVRGIVQPWLDALPDWNPHTNWVVSLKY